MKRKSVLLTAIILLLLALSIAKSVQAMSSTSYSLDWFTPLTSNGGGPASSAHYAINITVGQTVTGHATSSSYGAGMGYWYGILTKFLTNLPLVTK